MKIKQLLDIMEPGKEYKESELLKLNDCIAAHKELSGLLYYGYKTGRIWRRQIQDGKRFHYIHMKVSKTKIEPFTSKENWQYYGCGHTHKNVIVTDSNALTMSAYLDWKDSTGFEGDKSKCFDCYCRRIIR